ncbi:hypothetical protein Patl1_12817 [Pistacia atlantica]|uniref:Uncharacterized protein n=1 Tax=Pistacia atlantica TaxID=434234 RepID=A0ACC1AV23_9ROSI|nr:hypothetical protein Patl1_12817 [Pistacia atlantica]
MGSEAQIIPSINLSGEALDLDGERYKVLCTKVREALENHGCFIAFYDKISKGLREDMFMGMMSLFDLPEETKKKYVDPRPYRSYLGKSKIIPLHESFGLDNEAGDKMAQEFTHLMWPEGNPSFCETLKSMSSKLVEMNNTIMKMIFESVGMGKLYNSHVEDSTSVLRIMKYKVPPSNESAMGLVPHTDKDTLTILCQNEVQGLELLNTQGQWITLIIPDGAFVVMAGDGLKARADAWSNARFIAAKHKVMLSEKRERYSFGLFAMPKEGATIQVPDELVDDDHPLLYQPFKFSDFFSYFVENISDDALELYAGV